MYKIFKKARKVVGWLGSSQTRCELDNLFANLSLDPPQGISDTLNTHLLNRWYSREKDPTCHCVLKYLENNALELVRQNPWFRRTWIRQEVFAAQKVEMRYGGYSFDLKRLIQLIQLVDPGHSQSELQLFHELVKRHVDFARPFIRTRAYAHPSLENRTSRWLEAVLSNAQGFEATEARDRVFAVQSIAQPEATSHELLFPTIDYRLSTSELFEQFIKLLICSDDAYNLTPISIFEDRRDFQTGDLPSWVPDWRKIKTRLVGDYTRNYLPYGHKIDTTQQGVLSLDGVLLGTVGQEWPMQAYQASLSTSFGKNNKTFTLAGHKVYRSRTSSLASSHPFSEVSEILHVLEEITYRPYKYTIEAVTLSEDPWQPYVLASAIVRPGDLLVSFAWEVAMLSTAGYERQTPCSVLRPCPDRSGTYYFLGPCIFDHIVWHDSLQATYRAFRMDVQHYVLS